MRHGGRKFMRRRRKLDFPFRIGKVELAQQPAVQLFADWGDLNLLLLY